MFKQLACLCALFLLSHGREIPTETSVTFSPEKVHFWLWTRQNPSEYREIFVGDVETLINSSFDASLPTRITVHGFAGDGQDYFNIGARDEYLSREACNAIAVDWSALSWSPDYPRAVRNVIPTGELVGDLVNFLIINGLALANVHLIGFSLGAHVVGNAGRHLQETYNTTLPRITGLDPALPEFSLENIHKRLDTTDAEFVDIIHTNSGTLLQGGLSFKSPIGHIDFYPNGGSFQPGCPHSGIAVIDDLVSSCNHSRAPLYFIETINTQKGFIGTLCDNYKDYEAGLCAGNEQQLMGEYVPSTARGVFYLTTNSESPFALGY